VKLGVFDPVFGALDLEPTLDRVVELGVDAIEIGTGNFPGNARCDPATLLADADARRRFSEAVRSRGLLISALSCQGNPLHPEAARAAHDDEVFRDTVRLAGELGVGVVNVFAGCPGGDSTPGGRPNWIASSWPPEFAETLEWQWTDVVLPYWADAAAFADSHGVWIGVEMEPGFVVYNPRTMIRLREEIGGRIGVNLDPSHLFWQGIDVIDAVHALGSSIVHVDAKDTVIHEANVRANGILDLPPRAEHEARPWVFRSVGIGHDLAFWTEFVRALRAVGYDHVISIEHEDPFATIDEGLRLAAGTLRQALTDAGGSR